LPLHDKSDSFLIQKHLNMSKKTFKKAVGNLMRDGLVSMSTDGIQLKERGPRT
jgi:predicted RNA-binding protein (virulence factor B family)